MRELKYYKELPVRSLNQITYPLMLVGADCYIDIDENKYAFISFRNADKKPFFSLYLQIKEYNAQGTLIKESKFSIPTTYGRRGLYVTPEPAKIEKDTEGIEVFIQFAEFNKKNFFEDGWTKRRFVDLFPTKKVTSTSSIPFEVQPTKDEILSAARGEEVEETEPVNEETPAVEETPVVPEAKEESPIEETPVVEETPATEEENHEEAPKAEEKPEEISSEESTEEAESPVEVVKEQPRKVLPPVTETKIYDRKKNIVFPILLGFLFAIALTYVILDYFLSWNLLETIWQDFWNNVARRNPNI